LNASRIFDGKTAAKEVRKKEANFKDERIQMLKTIGQLMMKRDFRQG